MLLPGAPSGAATICGHTPLPPPAGNLKSFSKSADNNIESYTPLSLGLGHRHTDVPHSPPEPGASPIQEQNMKASSALAISGAGAVIGVWLLAAGCATERGPYSPITQADETAPHQTTHGVTMMDENVRNALLLRRTVATRTPMGQIQARITLQNAYREDIWADARFVFFNSQDEPVEIGQWRTVHFAPQDLVLVEAERAAEVAVRQL